MGQNAVTSEAAPDSVSVVITAYDADQWIALTLQSILDQTRPAQEVIVIDDGSTDNTASAVRGYAGRVRYFRQDRRGQPAARNRGIQAASGRWIAFCDADDLWHRRKLEAQIGLLQSHAYAWVACDAGWIDPDGNPAEVSAPQMRQGDVLEVLFLGNFIKSATPLVRRDVFEQVGYFEDAPEARIGEDWDMWLRIAARYPLGVVPQKLTTIRLHPDSMLARTPLTEKAQALQGVVERAAAREPERLAHLKGRASAAIWYAAGVEAVRAMRYDEARTYFGQALKNRPWNLAPRAYLLLCRLGPGIGAAVLRAKRQVW